MIKLITLLNINYVIIMTCIIFYISKKKFKESTHSTRHVKEHTRKCR